jgi:hypothetical protein
VVLPAEPQPTVVEERWLPVVVEAQQATAAAVARPEAVVQLAAPAAEALPAASAVEGHMVVGGRGHDAEASSSRAGRSASGEGRVDEPPAFADAQEEQQLWGSSVTMAPRSTEC